MPGLPPLTALRVVWGAPADWRVVAVCILAVESYLGGVYLLHRRGHRWPVGRTALWVTGWATIYLFAAGSYAGYAMVTFSAHMVQHMVLAMYTPVLLVLAAPVTLALRVLPANASPTSPRRLLVAFLHSRALAVLSSMPMAVCLFAFSLFGLYFTPLLSTLMWTMTGHEVMEAHFLITGYLFTWTLIGVDPGPRRPSEVVRLAVIVPLASVHAFFAVVVAVIPESLGQPFFVMAKPAWADLHSEQAAAGGLAGGLAEIPMLAIAAVLLLRWFRTMERRTPAAAQGLLVDGQRVG